MLIRLLVEPWYCGLDFFPQAVKTKINKIKVIASTGNIAFVVTRIMLLLGFFNYGKRGILDLTHTRLFTFSSFKKLFKDSGFNLICIKGIPAPFPLIFGDNFFSKILLNINRFFILISKSIFSYQIYFELEVRNNTFSELNFLENQLKKTKWKKKVKK